MLIATALVDQIVCNGGDPAVIDGGVASGGTGTYTYLWETSTASAGPYSPIATALSADNMIHLQVLPKRHTIGG